MPASRQRYAMSFGEHSNAVTPAAALLDVPRYRAAQASDGTFTIFGVPIFAAHSEERAEGQTVEFNDAWLNGALAVASRRQAEGYMAPLHVRHHGDGEVTAAGKFRMTRVGPITHDGLEVSAIFADLVGVRPEIFQRIMRGELSYRSVEILDVGRTEIDSLALLDDEVPFFRFPLLRVAVDQSPTRVDGGGQVTRAARGPALCYRAAGRSAAVLFQFKETHMADLKITGQAQAPDPSHKTANAEQLLMQIFNLLQQAMGPQAPEPGAAPAGPPMAPNPSAQANGGPGPVEQPQPMPPQAPPQMAQHPQNPQQPQMAQPIPPQAPPQMMPRATPVGAVMGMFTQKQLDEVAAVGNPGLETAGAVDGLAARMHALEAKYAVSEQTNAIERRATELATRGFSAEQVAKFRGTAATHGLPGANVYAQALEDHGPSTPPSHWTGEIHGEAPDCAEISKYAAQGPEVLAMARDYYRSWKKTGSTVEFDAYFQSNANPDAYMGAARKS